MRPLERELVGRTDVAAEALRGYCLAIRSALTDDGRPPLAASGLRLKARLEALATSLERVERTAAEAARADRELQKLLGRLLRLVRGGLAATAALWPPIQAAYTFVHRAAHLLANRDQLDPRALQQAYQRLLTELREQQAALAVLAPAAAHFRQVTASYWHGLFACYTVADLPRTNNDLEHYFGTVRHLERRATGRQGASPALVVRGAVRVVAAVATRLAPPDALDAAALQPRDLAAWMRQRQQVEERQATRRAQARFRRDPHAYLGH